MKLMTRKKADPKVRRDGRCVVCKGVRPPLAKSSKDPFCSATCCRDWHAVGGDAL